MFITSKETASEEKSSVSCGSCGGEFCKLSAASDDGKGMGFEASAFGAGRNGRRCGKIAGGDL